MVSARVVFGIFATEEVYMTNRPPAQRPTDETTGSDEPTVATNVTSYYSQQRPVHSQAELDSTRLDRLAQLWVPSQV